MRNTASTTMTALLFAGLLAAGSALAAAPATAPDAATAAASAPIAATISVAAPATGLAPEARQVLIGRTVVEVMQAHHYPADKLNPRFARAILKQYLDSLDPNRFYFTQTDVHRFLDKYSSKLAGDLKHGNLKPAFAIYDDYVTQANRKIRYALDLLKKKPDLTGEASFRFSRRHAPWAKNQAALKKLWKKRVKNDVLSLLLDGKSWKKTRKTLTRRYRHALNHVNQTKSNDVFDAWMNGYTQTSDPHSSYFSPFDAQQFQIAMSLQLQGVGAQLTERDNYVTVVRILPGGPAAQSKALKAGDRIVSVGEGKKGAMKDVVGWRLDDVVKMIRGPKGSTVRLKILPAGALPGGSAKTVTLVRNTIKLNQEHAHALIALIKHGTIAYKIGIITIPSFYVNFKAEGGGNHDYTSVTHDVRALIKTLKQKKVSGILLDLRNNGGGSLKEATALTGLFIPGGPVVQVKDRRGRVQVLKTPAGEKPAWRGPLTLLINRFSASATEIFAGALKDYHRALIVGSRSWGKGSVQQLVQLKRYLPGFKSGELKLTTAQFFRVNGASTQRHGVKPDIVIPDAVNDKKFGESSLPHALPWRKINAADYKPVKAGVASLISNISNYYRNKIQKQPRFELYLRQTKAQLAHSAHKTVSLNMKQRKAKRDAHRARELSFVNDWRKLAGKAPFKTLKAANDSKFDQPDVVLATGARLLADYINLAPSIAVKFNWVHRAAQGISPSQSKTICLPLPGGTPELSGPFFQFCGVHHGKHTQKTIYPPSARTNNAGETDER